MVRGLGETQNLGVIVARYKLIRVFEVAYGWFSNVSVEMSVLVRYIKLLRLLGRVHILISLFLQFQCSSYLLLCLMVQ